MDIALKQRLVGAIVIIALAVLVLPMLLGGRPDSSEIDSGKIEIPPQPSELSFETRRFPLSSEDEQGSNDRRDSSGSPASLPAPRQQELPKVEIAERPPADPGPGVDDASPGVDSEQAGKDSGSQLAESADPAPVETAEPVSPWPSQSNGEFLVQVASFGAAANANRMSESLSGMGMPVLSDSVRSSSGILHRVRVGPFGSQADADRAAEAIRAGMPDINPRVVRISPPDSAPSTASTDVPQTGQDSNASAAVPADAAPSDPLQRWVVQVGSFSSEANADKRVSEVFGIEQFRNRSRGLRCIFLLALLRCCSVVCCG